MALLNVTTKYGGAEGVLSAGGFALFKGIPYAAPPVGELRWKAPMPPSAWEGTRKFDKWAPASMQNASWSPEEFYGKEFYNHADYPPELSEDSLYLNVWTPAGSPGDKLPVMMWIHGGGVQAGYSHEIEFDGDAIAKRGVILVTINYRLNIFGYFGHAELSAESGVNASGNYGLMDQIAALRWINENIAAFGGDPGNVTVFGQSGGGRSTNAIACSPLSDGLLSRAIIQSGGGLNPSGGRHLPLSEVERRGKLFAEAMGAASVADLRKIPAAELSRRFLEISSKNPEIGFNISGDGYMLPQDISSLIKAGKQKDIDYIIGSTLNEGSGSPAKPAGDTREDAIDLIRKTSWIGAEAIIEAIPADATANDIVKLAHESRGLGMMAALRGFARVHDRQGKKPLFTYCFARQMPGDDVGAFHSSELWYIFGTLGRCWRPFTDEDYKLSELMTDYWTNFAKTGDPNGQGLPEWSRFTGASPLVMQLDAGRSGMTDYGAKPGLEKLTEAMIND